MQELEILDHVAEICATNSTAVELCRALVHSPSLGKDAVGAAVFLTSLSGDLDLIGSYGKTPDLGSDKSIWANNPLAQAILGTGAETGTMTNGNGDEFAVGAIKILKGNNPIGVIAMMRSNEASLLSKNLSATAMHSIGNLVGVWVDSLGIRPTGVTNGDPASSDDLTDRQLEILRQMAAGRTNAQIAADLILSESSIRQETVRIYRALGVGTRAEAARKGLNLGLIDKVSL